MELQTGDHWSKLLKSVAIAMNSTKKRSHGQTPFKVMWGRESRHQDLLSAILDLDLNEDSDFELKEAIISETVPPEDECVDLFCPLHDQPHEEVALIHAARAATNKSAMDCINFEQLRQKIHYDKNVTSNS